MSDSLVTTALVDQVLHVMTPAEWGKPIDVNEKWTTFVDDNVMASMLWRNTPGSCQLVDPGFHDFTLLTRGTSPALSSGTEVDDIVPHGISYWSRTAEVSTRDRDGTPRSYFLKAGT